MKKLINKIRNYFKIEDESKTTKKVEHKLEEISNLKIQFKRVKNIEEVGSLLKPFLREESIIFFKEELRSHENYFYLIVINDDEFEALLKVLTTLSEQKVSYKLSSSISIESEDSEGADYFDSFCRETVFFSLKELKELSFYYMSFSENPKDLNFHAHDMAVSNDGKYIAVARYPGITLWCAKSYKFIGEYYADRGGSEDIRKVVFTSDSKYFLCLVYDDGATGTDSIEVWRPTENEEIVNVKRLNEEEYLELEDIAPYNDSTRDLLDNYEEFFDVNANGEPNELTYLFETLRIGSIAMQDTPEMYSYDFSYIVSTHKNTISLYATNDFSFKKDFSLLAEANLTFPSKVLCFTNDLKYLCVAFKENIELLCLTDLKQVKILKSHTKNVLKAVASRDNKYLASASKDGEIKLWSLSSFELIFTIKSKSNIISLDFSSDSTQLIFLLQEGLKVWDIKENKALVHMFASEFWFLKNGEDEVLNKGRVKQIP
jgi:WD40 repeat protein